MDLVEVLRIIVDGFVFPRDSLTFLMNPPKQILDIVDFNNLSYVCKALRTFVWNIKYMHYNITELDYLVDFGVQKHRAAFLYFQNEPIVIRRFLQIFGCVYGDADQVTAALYYEGRKPIIDHSITPLHVKCKDGRVDEAKLIIQHDPRMLDCMDRDGYTPIFHALTKHHSDLLTYIVTNYPEQINRSCAGDDYTPLAVACNLGWVEYIMLLINLGANPNIPVNDPPIFEALSSLNILREFLKSKIPVDFSVTSRHGYDICEYIIMNKRFSIHDAGARIHWHDIEEIICKYLNISSINDIPRKN